MQDLMLIVSELPSSQTFNKVISFPLTRHEVKFCNKILVRTSTSFNGNLTEN